MGGLERRRGGDEVRDFVATLPFRLTRAQERVVGEILGDLEAEHPMMRLIQGDVGSGKTVVAAIACLKAIACGVQAAIMAPTELLAEQHWKSLTELFSATGFEVVDVRDTPDRPSPVFVFAASATATGKPTVVSGP